MALPIPISPIPLPFHSILSFFFFFSSFYGLEGIKKIFNKLNFFNFLLGVRTLFFSFLIFSLPAHLPLLTS